ncbi:MAG: D-alanine--D-alanine ligase [bacterium]|nr:D-alanine--D-alanine ligase [bacterium]
MSKLTVGILYGGRSTEHEVSVASATTVFKALDPGRYTPVLIGVDHDGQWHIAGPELELLPEAVFGSREAQSGFATLREGLEMLRREDAQPVLGAPLDVIFPIIHGRGGEDGSLQGLLELAGIPYVGAGIASTALCMDKVLSKAVLRDAGVPVLPCREASRARLLVSADSFIEEVEEAFPYPVFVKPANTGSSVGVTRAHSRSQLHEGLKEASRFDLDVLVEPGVDVREVECAVLGGHDPRASVLGEVAFSGEFYDYEAKYVSDDTRLMIPADLPEPLAEQMRETALKAYRALKCWGMARVDFFVERNGGNFWLNELNTLPGFTDGSMYARLWDASGIAVPELVDHLLELALERGREQQSLEIRFRS